MTWLNYAFANVVETLLRGFPFPAKTGLIKVGNPDRHSPVLLTCNFHLTVERVRRASKGLDAYLLIANSRGINVWCGAAGGHFTNHDVISALKTSGIEELVDHRNVVLPQLAATGIESSVVRKKTGWKVIWGPVYARDIPAFIENGFRKTPGMREVKFPLTQRAEMAVMWAFPFSIITGLIAAFLWPDILLPLIGVTWLLPVSVFLSFPVYSSWINTKKKGTGFSRYTILFDFSRTILILWGTSMLFLFLSVLAGLLSWTGALGWAFILLVIFLITSLDLMGSTPVYKSGLHEDRFLRVVLDEERCKGAGFCEEVCPRNCFEVDRNRHTATMPRENQCVQCGACIVQCSFDALYFRSPKGQLLLPETLRKFKLNLMGRRLVRAEWKELSPNQVRV